MENPKHIIIFSHGFGVKKDDRGLLSDIAKAFPGSTTYLFDYFDVDEENMSITTCSFTKQVEKLKDIYNEAKKQHPGAVIDIIAHSQGTLIPPLSKLGGIRKTIFLAPVFDMSVERTLKRYSSDTESNINLEGISKFRKLDGYVRYVPKEYWIERRTLNPSKVYNEYASETELVVINANQDNVLGNADTSLLSSNIQVLSLDGNHEFAGEARSKLIQTIKEIISK